MILLSLPPVVGDCQIPTAGGVTSMNAISCTQISWDLAREFKESAKGGTADVFTGVADVKPITLNKTLDCSSPDLMQYSCGGGKLGDTATIYLIASGAGDDLAANLYCQFDLQSPIIASWNISGGEDERPTETLSLWYYKVKFQYWQIVAGKNKVGPFGPRGWDRILNKIWN